RFARPKDEADFQTPDNGGQSFPGLYSINETFESGPRREKIHAFMIRRALIFYGFLTLLGVVLTRFFDLQPILFIPARDNTPSLWFQLLFGVGSAALVGLLGLLM